MSTTLGTVPPTGTAATVSSLASSILSTLSDAVASTTTSANPSRTTDSAPATSSAPPENAPGSAQQDQGLTLIAFLTALAFSVIVFSIQIAIFLLIRNGLARIFKPKTYLVPERERTEAPPRNVFGLLRSLMSYSDKELIKKCGLDAYFFLRYLKTLLVIFVPIATVVIPILVPINYVGGRGQSLVTNTTDDLDTLDLDLPKGLDTLAWGNVRPENSRRRWAHLILALGVIIWVCTVFFFEMRVYVKVRQDYLTSAEHRLRASATTVLVNNIPSKWLSEEALRGLFDVFPGGIRNIWLNRSLGGLLSKVEERNSYHHKLESAETSLIRLAKKKQLKKRAAEEKKARKQQHAKGPTKQEKELREKQEDAEAMRRAEAGEGVSSGDHEEVPHDVRAAVDESREEQDEMAGNEKRDNEPVEKEQPKGFKIPILSDGLSKVGQGLRGGVEKAGLGFKTLGQGVEDTLETTNGFTKIGSSAAVEPSSAPPTRGSDRRRVQISTDDNGRPGTAGGHPRTSNASEAFRTNHSRTASAASRDTDQNKRSFEPPVFGNTVRKASNLDEMFIKDETKFWQFWKPPAGGFASPIPQGVDEEFAFGQKSDNKTLWEKVKSVFSSDDESATDYMSASSTDPADLETGAEWEKWIKAKDRPTHRIHRDGVPGWLQWLPCLPLLSLKVDTIYHCRKELARLNLEIEEDQQHPEKYQLMNSAFIQFNHQVSAHMACQSLMHHVPKQMAPRVNEISPKDILWDNMDMKWWQEWIRGTIVTLIVLAMIILWAIPVAWTAALANVDSLIARFEFLAWIRDNSTVYKLAGAVAGLLPPILLAILLILVPFILSILAKVSGVKTGSQVSEFVQRYFFVFLFIQVFLIVSIASFFAASLDDLFANVQQLTDITFVYTTLAKNLPKAANYFFTYMILQALSTSSGTLLQVGALVVWYVLARIFDSTPRHKWTRNTTLSSIVWGAFFPVYTNFACIALIYSVVAPLISLFAIITFGLLWVAQRYSMLYVTRFVNDTGGVLYPRAINQTFTGLYVMELCLAGLFLIATDEKGNNSSTAQGIIMLASMGLTAGYQIVLNRSFSPLFRYLPITVEDEAVLRDEAFQRAQDRRLGLVDESDDDEQAPMRKAGGDDIDGGKLDSRRRRGKLSKLNPVGHMGTWAKRGGKNLRDLTWNNTPQNMKSAADYRRQQRQKDLEAQRAIGEALYGGYHDEIEDLTPEERDLLVKHSFQHMALRARRPTVWIPRDDLGISDDEIRRTQEYSNYIWISNEGTALDSKVRVVYGRNPPDFSEIDLIDL